MEREEGIYVLWGIGNNGAIAIERFGIPAIAAFIDRSLAGTAFYLGRPVIDLSIYMESYRDKLLVVTPTRCEDMVRMLKERGIESYLLFRDVIY